MCSHVFLLIIPTYFVENRILALLCLLYDSIIIDIFVNRTVLDHCHTFRIKLIGENKYTIMSSLIFTYQVVTNNFNFINVL